MQDNGGMQENNPNLFPVNGPQQYNSGTQQEWGGQPAQVNQPAQPIQTSPFNQPNESLTAQPITQPTAEFVDNNPANINFDIIVYLQLRGLIGANFNVSIGSSHVCRTTSFNQTTKQRVNLCSVE